MARHCTARPRRLAGRPDRGRPAGRAAARRPGGAPHRTGGRGRRRRRRRRALVAAQPLRETRWHLLALALYRSGRQSDALAALASGPADPAGRARPRPGSAAGRPRAGDPQPRPDLAAADRRPRGRTSASARTKACSSTTAATPTGSSAATTRSPPACGCCATRRCSWWPGRPGRGKSSLVRAGVVPPAGAGRATCRGHLARHRSRGGARRRGRRGAPATTWCWSSTSSRSSSPAATGPDRHAPSSTAGRSRRTLARGVVAGRAGRPARRPVRRRPRSPGWSSAACTW